MSRLHHLTILRVGRLLTVNSELTVDDGDPSCLKCYHCPSNPSSDCLTGFRRRLGVVELVLGRILVLTSLRRGLIVVLLIVVELLRHLADALHLAWEGQEYGRVSCHDWDAFGGKGT